MQLVQKDFQDSVPADSVLVFPRLAATVGITNKMVPRMRVQFCSLVTVGGSGVPLGFPHNINIHRGVSVKLFS